MALKRKLLENYFAQGYSIAASIVILPAYLTITGPEAFGLIGLFSLLQACMKLVDLGFTITISREVARLKAKLEAQPRLHAVVLSMERCFWGVSSLLGIALLIASPFANDRWIKSASLESGLVTVCFALMAVASVLRWQAAFYRSALTGYEVLRWISRFEVIVTTFRFPATLLIMTLFSLNIGFFFACQAVIAASEVFFARQKLRRLMGPRPAGVRYSWSELAPLMPLAMSSAYAGLIGVALSQFDKLYLSQLLTLEEFGYFSLITVITTGILSLTGPITRAFMPRLNAVLAQSESVKLIELYRAATRYVVSSITPLAMIISLWPKSVIYAWSGDLKAAQWTAEFLPLYTIGSAVVSITGLQLYLQQAHGNLTYTTRTATVALMINIPMVVLCANHGGVAAVAGGLLVLRLSVFLSIFPFIHRKYAPGLHFQWLLGDCLTTATLPILILLCAKNLLPSSLWSLEKDRVGVMIFLVLITLAAYTAQMIWLRYLNRLRLFPQLR